ncbi:HEPN domain-containing protein [Lutibacter sp. A80]|uniref:HEPN domain-containing protein n=1 Tax=Lutibacter sp. A80 TaxID=2918453 RepID=UPI001F05A719|nr:HEPN domain-containing protein [Lutibacter sp. A80]UMB61199.1 HEPN domain-containing protein [Lutibacter sp. A80]
MEKIKNKFEIILGFVTLVISLSAFKEELSQINIDLGFKTITFADYFLYSVIGFSISLYLYILEIVVRDTKIGKWKIFDYTLKIAYSLFALIIFSPLIIVLSFILFQINLILKENEKFANIIITVMNILISGLTIFYSVLVAKKYRLESKLKFQEQAEENEIKGLDSANKLFRDGYYSHSILESYKILETHLYKMIRARDIRVSKFRFNDLISISLKENIISKDDLIKIENLRKMRNISAHTDQDHTKQQAENSLEFVKGLLKR